jgi:hypothetical protein
MGPQSLGTAPEESQEESIRGEKNNEYVIF